MGWNAGIDYFQQNGWYRPKPSGGGGGDVAETTAFLARADASTTLTEPYRTAIRNLINGMVADGDFSLMEFFYFFATDTQTHALLDLTTHAKNGTTHGTISFSAGHGYTGDGSTFYIDSGFVPGTGGYTATSSSIGVYVAASRTTGQSWQAIGHNSDGAVEFHSVFPKFTDGNAYAQFSGNASVATTDAKAIWIGVRTSASAQALWKNGTSVVSNSSATGNAGHDNIFVFAGNNNSTGIVNYSGDQMSIAFAGSGSINVANVNTRIQTALTALGI
jgi:hypothetical protein